MFKQVVCVNSCFICRQIQLNILIYEEVIAFDLHLKSQVNDSNLCGNLLPRKLDKFSNTNYMLVIKYVHVECEMLPFVPCTPTWPQKHRNTWTLGPGWSWRGVGMQGVAMMDTDLQISNFCPLLHIKLFCGVTVHI